MNESDARKTAEGVVLCVGAKFVRFRPQVIYKLSFYYILKIYKYYNNLTEVEQANSITFYIEA